MFRNLTNGGTISALSTTLSFNEARLQMLANNVANIETPGFRTKTLDQVGFQRALREALGKHDADRTRPLDVNSGSEVQTKSDGRLMVTPSDQPVESLLFHDGTNQSIERQMSELAKTGMTHDLATTLLRGQFETLRKAIRGTA